MTVDYFNEHVRPGIPAFRFGPQAVGFDRADLDAWVERIKQWEGSEHPASLSVAISGGSTRPSEAHALKKALVRASSRKRSGVLICNRSVSGQGVAYAKYRTRSMPSCVTLHEHSRSLP